MAVGWFFTAIVEIVSFTSISNVSDFPSYVTVIVCFPTGNPVLEFVVLSVHEFISAFVADFVTALSVIDIPVISAPLFFVAFIVPPVKSIGSVSSYSTLLGLFVIVILTTGSVIVNGTVAVDVPSLYTRVTTPLFTSAFVGVAVNSDDVMSISSVSPLSYVTVTFPPVKSIVSPCSYSVSVGFWATEIPVTIL